MKEIVVYHTRLTSEARVAHRFVWADGGSGCRERMGVGGNVIGGYGVGGITSEIIGVLEI